MSLWKDEWDDVIEGRMFIPRKTDPEITFRLTPLPDEDAPSEKLLEWVGKYLPNKHNACILDVGCGNGRNLFGLYREGYRNLFGLDAHPPNLEKAQVRAEREGACLRIRHGMTQNLSMFDDHCFDLVIHWLELMVLPSLYDVEQAIRETHRVLKPSGYVMIMTIDKKTLDDVESLERFKEEYTQKRSGLLYLSEQTLDGVLRKYGFKFLEKALFYYPPLKTSDLRVVYRK
ncbi:MAG: class I SAM-dependent methyltransferase [Candidatus Bathyarchaeia archaeon]